MDKARCARHEKFPLNDFIAIAIVRHSVEVIYRQERLNLSTHNPSMPCDSNTGIVAANSRPSVAARGLTLPFSGAANGIGRTIRNLLRGLRCNGLLDSPYCHSPHAS